MGVSMETAKALAGATSQVQKRRSRQPRVPVEFPSASLHFGARGEQEAL